MDKKFLYSMVAVLALANATVYIQKTNPSFFANLIPNSSSETESWIKEDPGWTNQDFPKSDTAPIVPPKVDPIPPKTEPVPPRVQPQQPPQQPPQRRQPRRNDDCPRCQPG